MTVARITGISSMATKAVLAELAAAYARATGTAVAIESVGGVDAAQRVRDGEAFDAVFLAADALDRLEAEGHVVPGSRADLFRSPVFVAVPAGAPLPDIATEDALRRAVLAARTVGHSTGPSGNHLARLFEAWGIADAMRARTVQARPGVPVAALVARGEVALGFQQLSELAGAEGIAVVGPLPPEIQNVTTFGGAVCRASAQPDAARALLDFIAAPDADAAKRRHGMEPAR